jgi:DNA polymerase I-like protein with 3'-5' exonuclease and polymerase domains
VKESFESQTAALIKKEMEQAVKLDVPLTVDMVSGRNWNDVELLVERDSED